MNSSDESILKLDDLIERASPFPINFEDSERVRVLLDAIGEGVDLSVGASLIPFSKQ
jgi:hypothetical protein